MGRLGAMVPVRGGRFKEVGVGTPSVGFVIFEGGGGLRVYVLSSQGGGRGGWVVDGTGDMAGR